MTVVGDGLQTRDMTHVNDVVDANIKAAKQCIEGIRNRFNGEIFNIGTGINISVLDLAKEIQLMLKEKGIESGIVFIPFRPGEAQNTKADISKAQKFIGWKPEILFKDGLYTQMEYYLKKYGYR